MWWRYFTVWIISKRVLSLSWCKLPPLKTSYATLILFYLGIIYQNFYLQHFLLYAWLFAAPYPLLQAQQFFPSHYIGIVTVNLIILYELLCFNTAFSPKYSYLSCLACSSVIHCIFRPRGSRSVATSPKNRVSKNNSSSSLFAITRSAAPLS